MRATTKETVDWGHCTEITLKKQHRLNQNQRETERERERERERVIVPTESSFDLAHSKFCLLQRTFFPL